MNLWRLFIPLLLAVILGLALSDNAFAQPSSSGQTSNGQSQRRPPFASYNSLYASPNTNSSLNPVDSEADNQLVTQVKPVTKKGLRSIEGTWNIRLQQRQLQDDFNQETTTEFRLQADLRYKPVENINFRLAPKFNYATGFIQTEQVSRPSKTEWGVKEASINADLLSSVSVSAGALDQETNHPLILLADQAFPALRLKLHTSEKEILSAGLYAETAIPTSSSLSTQTKEAEKTPSFNSGTLFMKVQKTIIEGEAKIGAYQYQNLPSSVATESTYLGNTTESSTGANDSQFIYQYEGPFASAGVTANVTKYFRLLAAGNWIQDSKAPSGFNQGMWAKVGFEADLIHGFQIQPFYEYFRVEPDATVAAYNHPGLNTNRAGYMGGLSVSYRKILKVTASAGESDAIYETPYQMRDKIWFLKLETLDVAI